MFAVLTFRLPKLRPFLKDHHMSHDTRSTDPRLRELQPAPIQKLEPRFDLPGWIIDYESGALSEEQVIAGFQRLIDSGMAWSLQGSYGRMARTLIDRGDCHMPGQPAEM